MKKFIIGMMVLTSFSAFAEVTKECGKISSIRTDGTYISAAKLDSGAVLTHLSAEEFAVLAAAKIAEKEVCVLTIQKPTARSIELK